METGYYKGEGSQRETIKTNRLKQAEMQITGLTDKAQEDQIQNTQESGIKIQATEWQESGIIEKQRKANNSHCYYKQLKSADLNTLGE